MSHTIENKYIGNLRTSSKHLKSGDNVITDAPTDTMERVKHLLQQILYLQHCLVA